MAASPRSLEAILQTLPPKEFTELLKRAAVRLDPAKRIDPPAQLARALVHAGEARTRVQLQGSAAELLFRVARAGGSLPVSSLSPAYEALHRMGLLFAEPATSQSGPGVVTGVVTGVVPGFQLVLPVAHLLTLPPWEGEDARGMRALLAQTTSDAKGAIAAYYLGRPATPPLTLALEQAWGALSDPERLRVELNRLSPLERRVLDTIEELGGEVSTEELLEVEREPMRLRTTSGATPSRRGVGFAVERRGFLIPLHPNRHVIPSEVSAILSASVIAQRQATRARVRLGVEAEDHAPHRAQFSEDPGPLALAIVLAARELRGEVKAGVGTPRTLLSRIASRLGREGRPVAILTALSRTLGLWGTFTADEPTGLGALTLPELTAELFRVWRTGGSWDEAREDGEILRHPPEIREASPIGHLKQAVLDALSELGEGRWVPLSALLDFLGSDPREPGQARLVRRWSERIGADPVSLRTIAERILCETLPALGVVDLGLDQDAKVRLSSRGRALVQSRPVPTNEATTEFVDASVLRIGTRTPLGSVLALPPALEVGRVDKDISLLLDPQTLPNLLASGLDLDAFQAQLDALAPLPEGLRQAFAQANKVVGKGSLVATMGFLWVDQRELRDLLREHRNTADLFVDPSPPGGLLVKAGVEVDRLVKRCRSLGVEVHHENEVLLASSSRERSRRRR